MTTTAWPRKATTAILTLMLTLGAAIGLGNTATASDQQPGPRGYATVILAPHQDDEILRLAGYILYASDQGDDLALVTATDGGATAVRQKLDLAYDQTVEWRNREQAAAWAWLTDGRGQEPINLGFPDGAVQVDQIVAELDRLYAEMPGKPELYVATWHHDRPESKPGHSGDQHPDHVATVQAARIMAAKGVTVRYALHPGKVNSMSGTRYEATTPHQKERLAAAIRSYGTIGKRSVSALFNQLQANNGRSRVTW